MEVLAERHSFYPEGHVDVALPNVLTLGSSRDDFGDVDSDSHGTSDLEIRARNVPIEMHQSRILIVSMMSVMIISMPTSKCKNIIKTIRYANKHKKFSNKTRNKIKTR